MVGLTVVETPLKLGLLGLWKHHGVTRRKCGVEQELMGWDLRLDMQMTKSGFPEKNIPYKNHKSFLKGSFILRYSWERLCALREKNMQAFRQVDKIFVFTDKDLTEREERLLLKKIFPARCRKQTFLLLETNSCVLQWGRRRRYRTRPSLSG